MVDSLAIAETGSPQLFRPSHPKSIDISWLPRLGKGSALFTVLGAILRR